MKFAEGLKTQLDERLKLEIPASYEQNEADEDQNQWACYYDCKKIIRSFEEFNPNNVLSIEEYGACIEYITDYLKI